MSSKAVRICQEFYSTQFRVGEVHKLFTNGAPYREWAFFVPTLDRAATIAKQQTQPSSSDHDEEDLYSVHMWRHLFFPTLDAMNDAIQKLRPVRIDCGAVYASMEPENCNVVGREFCTDIDVNECDVGFKNRSCVCTGSNFCKSCWPLVAVGAQQVVGRLRSVGAAEDDIRVDYTGGRSFHIRHMSRTIAAAFSPSQPVRVAFRKLLLGDLVRPVTIEGATQFVSRLYPSRLDLLEVFCEVTFRHERFSFQTWYLKEHLSVATRALYTVLHTAQDRVYWMKLNKATLTSDDHMEFTALQRVIQLIDRIERSVAYTPAPDSNLAAVLKVDTEALGHEITLAMSRFDIQMMGETARVVPWQCTVFYCALVAGITCMYVRDDINPSVQPSHLLRSPLGIHATHMRAGVQVPLADVAAMYPIPSP